MSNNKIGGIDKKLLEKFFAWTVRYGYEKKTSETWEKDGVVYSSNALFNKWFFEYYTQRKGRLYIWIGILLISAQSILITLHIQKEQYIASAFGFILVIAAILLILMIRKSMKKWKKFQS